MINIIELLLTNNLKKIINCYCEECVGRSSLGAAEPIMEFEDTNLANPNGCLCYDCIVRHTNPNPENWVNLYYMYNRVYFTYTWQNENIFSCHMTSDEVGKYIMNRSNPIMKFNDLDTTEYTCWCLDCLQEKNGKIYHEYPSIEIYPKFISYDYDHISTNARCTKSIIDIYEGTIYECGTREVSLCGVTTDLQINRDFSIDTFLKIMYYKEYGGYTYNEEDEEIYQNTYSSNSFADWINFFRNVDAKDLKNMYLNNTETKYMTGGFKHFKKKYYNVIDQYCYECEKYKGACLSHVYPDPDEFKNVVAKLISFQVA